MKSLKKFRAYVEEVGEGAPAGGALANTTGDSPTMAMPASMNPMGLIRRKKYRQFEVESTTFRKFEKGRVPFERWARFLDMQNEKHQEIYNYARQHRHHMIVLKDAGTGALRAIRRRSVDGL